MDLETIPELIQSKPKESDLKLNSSVLSIEKLEMAKSNFLYTQNEQHIN